MKALLSLLFISILLTVHAQQMDKIDSLHRVLVSANIKDTTVIDALNLICRAYSPFNFDSANYYGEKALKLSRQIKDRQREAWSMNRMGIVYDYKGDIETALRWYHQSVYLYMSMGDTSRVSDVYINMGVCYHYGTMYDSALSYYLRAVALKEKIHSYVKLEYAFNNIGLIFRMQENYTKALEYYQKSLALKRKLNDRPGIITTLGNMATSYQSLKLYDSAGGLILQGLRLAEEMGDSSLLAWSHLNLSQNYFLQGKFDEALKSELNVQRSLSKYLEHRDLLTHQHLLASTYLHLKKYNQAKDHFLRAETLARELGMTEMTLKIYSGLSALHEEMKDYQNSLTYYKKFDSLTDLMFNKEKVSIVEGLEEKYQSELKEKEIAELEIDKQKSVNQRNVFILVASIVVLVSIFLYLLLRSKSKSNAIISKSLGEKETLLKEIHHRVKNNLQVISSLLSLQSRYIKDGKAIQAVTESKNRVRSMALIHQKLYQKDNLIGIDMADYIENLSDSLFASYGLEKNNENWHLNAESLRLDIDTTIPLGLIINELISNALKHAFADFKEAKLIIELNRVNNNLVLRVSDNGTGFDAEKVVKKDSFGLNLIDSLARKLKASVNVDSTNGTSFTLDISNYKLI